LTGTGSSVFQRFALKPKGIFNCLISSIVFSIISGDTHAAINPNQFSSLHFPTTSLIVSPDGSLPFFLTCRPTSTGNFSFFVISRAI